MPSRSWRDGRGRDDTADGCHGRGHHVRRLVGKMKDSDRRSDGTLGLLPVEKHRLLRRSRFEESFEIIESNRII